MSKGYATGRLQCWIVELVMVIAMLISLITLQYYQPLWGLKLSGYFIKRARRNNSDTKM